MSVNERVEAVYKLEKLVEELRQFALPEDWQVIEHSMQNFLTTTLDNEDSLWDALANLGGVLSTVKIYSDEVKSTDGLIIKAARETTFAKKARENRL